MKKHILLLGLMILILAASAGCQADSSNNSNNSNKGGVNVGPSVGNRAPGFELSNLSGGKVSLESLRGKPVFLNFWATWCPPCRSEMPDLQDMYLKYDGQVHFLTVNSQESANTVRKFMQENKYTFPVVLDKSGAVGTKYRITGIPTTLILDAKGIVRKSHIGALMAVDMDALIQAVLE